MHVVESLTNAIVAPMNAFFGTATVKGNYMQTGSSSDAGEHAQLLEQTRQVVNGCDVPRENDAAIWSSAE